MLSWKYSEPIRPVKKFISNKNTVYILGVILLAIMWQALSLWVDEEVFIFPGPVKTFAYAAELLQRPYTWRCISATMLKMLSGFVIALISAFVLGVLAGNFPFIEKLFAPSIVALRAIPTASLVYLFIVLAGFKKAPVFLVILICFPIIYEAVAAGIRNVPESIIKALKVDGAGFLKANLKIRVPLAMPYIIVAMASSFSLSFKIEIMAEVITGSTNPGLGSAIAGARATDPANMVPVFAYSLIAVGIMLMIDFIANLLKNKLQGNSL